MHTSQQATPAADAARRQRRLLPSRRGRLVCDGKVDFTVFIEFCKRLLRAADTPVYLVVDGPTVDGYPLDSAHENLGAQNYNGECGCDRPEQCEQARRRADDLPLPTGAELAMLIIEALN